MLNKKADVAITLLVFMTLLLAGATLFSFVLAGKDTKVQLSSVELVDMAHLREAQIEFYMREAGEKALANSYDAGKFDEDKFKENFKSEVEKYKFDELGRKTAMVLSDLSKVSYTLLENFADWIAEGKFDVISSDEFLEIQLFPNEIQISSKIDSVTYLPRIKVKLQKGG